MPLVGDTAGACEQGMWRKHTKPKSLDLKVWKPPGEDEDPFDPFHSQAEGGSSFFTFLPRLLTWQLPAGAAVTGEAWRLGLEDSPRGLPQTFSGHGSS